MELSVSDVKLTPQELAELITLIIVTIGGKNGKHIFFELLAKSGIVQGKIKNKRLGLEIPVDPAPQPPLTDGVASKGEETTDFEEGPKPEMTSND